MKIGAIQTGLKENQVMVMVMMMMMVMVMVMVYSHPGQAGQHSLGGIFDGGGGQVRVLAELIFHL